MGYRDDFYCMANLLGYTGRLNDFPTLYFQKTTWFGGIYFGHITQKHFMPGNVGRTPVQGPDPSYTAENELRHGGKLVERARGRLLHVSRNPLIRREQMNPAQLAFCANALRQCAYEKYMPGYSEEDRLLMRVQRQFKLGINPQTLGAAIGRRHALAERRQIDVDFRKLMTANKRLASAGDLARQRRGL
jgi:hypothetical protein